MTDSAFADRLIERAEVAGIDVKIDVVEKLVVYWSLLTKWTDTINLTSLPLDPPTDVAIDRLFIEPLIAAPYVPSASRLWFDLGSGGGSPAIPMKICHLEAPLVMVESRERKGMFLREVARRLELPSVDVAINRFETIAKERMHTADVVTFRAVRADDQLAKTLKLLLADGGFVLYFQSDSRPVTLMGLEIRDVHHLRRAPTSTTLVEYVPRGTYQ